jgi:phosphate transport system substrate-binding protein
MRWTAVRPARALLIVIAMFLAFTLACSRTRRDPNRDIIAGKYPRVDGSTSTHPLSVLVACKVHGVAYEWKRPPGLERTVFPFRKAHPLLAARIEETVQHHGTHEAYIALIQDKADLILVARQPSERELEAARLAGVGLDVSPIALDALVFVLNVNNPIESLTLNQVRDIFGPPGTKSWIGLGGPDLAIEPFQREPDSGSQELMEKLVMKGSPIRNEREVPRIYTMAGVVNTVAVHEHGIAYSIYYYVTNMAPNNHVKMIAIDGVKPTARTIATRAYPLTAEVFVVLRKGMPRESPAALLRDWLQTAEGQAAVQESGYVPRG